MLRLLNIIILAITLCACQKTEKKTYSTEETKTDIPSITTNVSAMKNEEDVEAFMKESGFLIESNGKKIYREDQLGNATSVNIASSITILSQNQEENKMAIFYLKVAGSGLDDEKEIERFINKVILNDVSYLDQVDRMVKFLQRQDRPVMEKALLGIVKQMSPKQCVDYLQMTGYVSGTDKSNYQYQPKVLKSLPMELKLAIVNKLRSAKDGKVNAVFDQLILDLGINS